MAERDEQAQGLGRGGVLGRLRRVGSVAWRAAVESLDDNVTDWAAAVAFYGLLSLFPLMLAGISVAASVADREWAIREATTLFSRFFMRDTALIDRTLREVFEARGAAGILGFLALVWSGSRVFNTLTTALNIAYDVDKPYSFLKSTVIQVVMTLTLGVLFLAVAGAGLVFEAAKPALDSLPLARHAPVAALTWIAITLLTAFVFFLVYQFVPRGKRDVRASLIGALVATALFAAARPVFGAYVARFAEYNLVYGSLAVVVLTLMWAWVTACIVLYGGEVAAVLESDRAKRRAALEGAAAPGAEAEAARRKDEAERADDGDGDGERAGRRHPHGGVAEPA